MANDPETAILAFPTKAFPRRCAPDEMSEPTLPAGWLCGDCTRFIECSRSIGCTHDAVTCAYLPSWFEVADGR